MAEKATRFALFLLAKNSKQEVKQVLVIWDRLPTKNILAIFYTCLKQKKNNGKQITINLMKTWTNVCYESLVKVGLPEIKWTENEKYDRL